MSEAKTDLRQIACQYRDHLTSELAKVEDFLEMADRLEAPEEDPGFGLTLFTGEAASVAVH